MKSFFKDSRRWGISYEIVYFLVSLLCGYFISFALEGALDQNFRKTLFWIGIFLVTAGIGIPVFYRISKEKSIRQKKDVSNFRSFLCQEMLNGRMTVKSAGEFDICMNDDAVTIAKYQQNSLVKAASNGIMMIICVLLLCLENWKFGLILAVANLLQLLPVIIYEKWAREIYNNVRDNEEEERNCIFEGYHGIRTIKSCQLEKWFFKRFLSIEDAVYKNGKKAEQAGTVENIVFEMTSSILTYGSYLLMGLFLFWGEISMGQTPVLIVVSGFLFSATEYIYLFRIDQASAKEAEGHLKISDQTKSFAEGNGKMLLSVRGLKRAYGEKILFNGYDKDVEEGSHILLQGENGCGKSTLLKIILGFEAPEDGVIYVNQSLWKKGPNYRQISFALQEEPELSLSAKELLSMLESEGEMTKAEAEKHFLGFHLTEELLEKPLAELSFGERKKVFLSFAFAKKAKLLVLDEPTNHLDTDGCGYLRELLDTYPQTVLVCSHDERLRDGWTSVWKFA